AAAGLVEGHFFVLAAILADQYRKAFSALHIQRYAATGRGWLATFTRFALALRVLFDLLLHQLAAHIASPLYLGFDQRYFSGILGQVEIGQELLDRGQFGVILLDLLRQQGQRAAQLVIFVEQAIGIAHGIETRIKRHLERGGLALTSVEVFQFHAFL